MKDTDQMNVLPVSSQALFQIYHCYKKIVSFEGHDLKSEDFDEF